MSGTERFVRIDWFQAANTVGSRKVSRGEHGGAVDQRHISASLCSLLLCALCVKPAALLV